MRRRKPTIRDVAARAGVSAAAVSYVLAPRPGRTISAATQGRIRRAARELVYRPDHAARALRTRRTGSVGVIIQGMTDPTLALIVKGVEIAAAEAGYGVLVHDLESGPDRADSVSRFCARAPDGLIYAFPPDHDKDVLAAITAARVPAVAIGRRVRGMGCVRFDQRVRGRMIAEHLAGLGHRRIMILTKPPKSRMRQRIEGIRAALRAHGITVQVVLCRPEGGERSQLFDVREYDMGFNAMTRLFARRRPCTALIGSNDMVAAGAANAAQALGIRIPRDLSVASFGGFLLSEVVQPKLTSVRSPYAEAARRAFALLREAMVDGTRISVREEVLPTELVVRGSTGPAPGAGRRPGRRSRGAA